MNIIKIRDSPFSLFTWYQSKKGKPNFFFGDRVSFWSLYSPFRTLRRWISSPPPPPSDLLAAGDFSSQLFSDRKPHIPRRTGPIYKSEETPPENSSAPLFSGGLPSTGRRVWVRGPLSGDEISYPPFCPFQLRRTPSIAILHGLGHFSSSTVPQP